MWEKERELGETLIVDSTVNLTGIICGLLADGDVSVTVPKYDPTPSPVMLTETMILPGVETEAGLVSSHPPPDAVVDDICISTEASESTEID